MWLFNHNIDLLSAQGSQFVEPAYSQVLRQNKVVGSFGTCAASKSFIILLHDTVVCPFFG